MLSPTALVGPPNIDMSEGLKVYCCILFIKSPDISTVCRKALRLLSYFLQPYGAAAAHQMFTICLVTVTHHYLKVWRHLPHHSPKFGIKYYNMIPEGRKSTRNIQRPR